MPKSKTLQPRSKALARQETLTAYLFLLPSLFFFVTFVIIPMFMCVFNSFFDYTSTSFAFADSIAPPAGLTLKPTIIAFDAAASITSDSAGRNERLKHHSKSRCSGFC